MSVGGVALAEQTQSTPDPLAEGQPGWLEDARATRATQGRGRASRRWKRLPGGRKNEY